MKNFIYNGIHSKVSKDLISSFTSEIKPETLVCISSLSEQDFVKPECKNFINVQYSAAIYGQFPDDHSTIDQQLLEALSPYFFTTIKMMERSSPELVYSFDDRLKIYHAQVRFWNNIIEKHKVDCFIGINYPHELYDYVIYTLCKVKKIKTLFFCQTQINGYIQLLSDIGENDLLLKQDIWPNIEKNQLSSIMQNHLETQCGNYSKPFYMELNQSALEKDFALKTKINKVVSLIKRVINKLFKIKPIPFSKIVNHFFFDQRFGSKVDLELANAYRKVAINPDLNKSFFYLPLHFQPECTTCPQGNYFVNQELMIDIVLKSLPSNTFLYVKEHPFQRPHGRRPEFYEKYSQERNLVFVNKDFNSQELITHSSGVVTVTGTAGWEALFKNKNVLLFGNIFFQYAPGVFQVNSLETCRQAIAVALSKNKLPTTKQMISFLYILEQNSIRGWVDEVYEKHSEISYEENLITLKKSLLNFLSN